MNSQEVIYLPDPDTSDDERYITGAGSRSQPRQPQVLDDDGRSTQKGYLVEAVGDGKTRIIDGLEGVYFDKTPVEIGGRRNFSGFVFRARQGIPGQEPLRDFGDEVTANYNVNAVVVHPQNANLTQRSVTRTAINNQLTSIRITISLQMYRSNGTKGDEMEFIIWGKRGNDPWRQRLRRTVKGKFGSPVAFEYDIGFANLGGSIDTFSVRVEKVTPDPVPGNNDDNGRINTLRWDSYTEVIKKLQYYANTSIVALEFNAEQFQSVPERKYLVERLDVAIPTNASVNPSGRLTYTGNWNGQFYVPNAGVTCPSWILYDIFTNTRYGFGRNPRLINVWKLYEMSLYNNQLVPDTFGGSHARYAIRTQIQTEEDEDRLLDLICSAMNARKFRANGQLTFWQDKPTNPTWTFTNADVENGDFIYSSTSVGSRFTSVTVNYNDTNDFWRLTPEIIEDQAGINRYGVQKTSIVAYGCNERGRAVRFGKWALYSNLNETELVTFRPRAFGALVNLGEVARIHDNRFFNFRYGGLVKSATTTVVELDQATSISDPIAQLQCLLPNGTYETRNILNRGDVSFVEVSPPFSIAPRPETTWAITTPNRPPTLWRIVNKVFLDDNPGVCELQGVEYRPEKYDYVEREISAPEPPPPPILPAVVAPPAGVFPNYRSANNTVEIGIDFGGNATARNAIVQVSDDGIVWQDAGIALPPFGASIQTLPTGSYRFRALTVDLQGRQSDWSYAWDVFPTTLFVLQVP